MRDGVASADYHIGYRFRIFLAVCESETVSGRCGRLNCQRGGNRVRLIYRSSRFQRGHAAVGLTIQGRGRNDVGRTGSQVVGSICSGLSSDLIAGADYLFRTGNCGSGLYNLPGYCLRIGRGQREVDSCLTGLAEGDRDGRHYRSIRCLRILLLAGVQRQACKACHDC